MTPFRSRGRSVAATASLFAFLVFTPCALAEPGEDLTISALTSGPSDHPFFKFGHNAILIQPKDGQGLVFNFGTFQFDSPALIPKFLRGRFKYWLSVAGAEDTMESYAAADRTILAQELDLTRPSGGPCGRPCATMPGRRIASTSMTISTTTVRLACATPSIA